MKKLIHKYNIPVPRYTSYPTAPVWGEQLDAYEDIIDIVQDVFQATNEDKGISIYIHIPYCEKLCTFCACHRIITKNHQVEAPYIEALLTEWRKYLNILPEKPIVRELHLGGGTPTFFSSKNLRYLISEIMKGAERHPEHEFSFEAHPGVTTREHLQVLNEVGFNRVSFGVQDFDPLVQEVINRVNTYEQVKEMTEVAREIGYKSINYDLVYGLPKQKLSSVKETIEQVAQLRPERIAFYSYAHVPWKSKTQRLFTESDLPDNESKRILYEEGKELLIANGYFDIGLDHFALPEDKLYQAYTKAELHRNFMGYNTTPTDVLIGLGASSISDFGRLYIQNEKQVKDYQNQLKSGQWAFYRSYILSEKDELLKRAILDIACRRKVTLTPQLKTEIGEGGLKELLNMEEEKLVIFKNDTMCVTDLGMVFLRNICSVFDAYYKKNKQLTFSKSI